MREAQNIVNVVIVVVNYHFGAAKIKCLMFQNSI